MIIYWSQETTIRNINFVAYKYNNSNTLRQMKKKIQNGAASKKLCGMWKSTLGGIMARVSS